MVLPDIPQTLARSLISWYKSSVCFETPKSDCNGALKHQNRVRIGRGCCLCVCNEETIRTLVVVVVSELSLSFFNSCSFLADIFLACSLRFLILDWVMISLNAHLPSLGSWHKIVKAFKEKQSDWTYTNITTLNLLAYLQLSLNLSSIKLEWKLFAFYKLQKLLSIHNKTSTHKPWRGN